MAEQADEIMQETGERHPPLTRAIGGYRRDLITGSEIRKAALPTQWFRGYQHAHVESLLERAASSIDELARMTNSLKSELDQVRATDSAPEAVITQMLATAAVVVGTTQEDAKREAAELVARARGEAEQITLLHEEAQATIDRARLDAAGILAAAQPEIEEMTRAAHAEAETTVAAARAEAAAAHAEAASILAAASAEAESLLAAARTESETLTSGARAEREQVLEDATRDAHEARTALEQEKATIDQAIDDLRDTWANRISTAIARLDAIDPGAGKKAAEDESPAAGPNGQREADMALELRDRLGGTGAMPDSAPVEGSDHAT